MEKTSKKSKEGRMRTVLVVRPLTQEEGREDPRGKHATLRLLPGGRKVVLVKEGTEREFDYESVVGGKTTSQETFFTQHCESAIHDLFSGYNTTFMAYGHVQTTFDDLYRPALGRPIQCSEARLLSMLWTINTHTSMLASPHDALLGYSNASHRFFSIITRAESGGAVQSDGDIYGYLHGQREGLIR